MLKKLAKRIQAAQDPEIAHMSAWLKEWNELPPADMSGHSGMPGMMGDQEMSGLAAATGVAFDQMFLQMMIRHHEGAIKMARSEQRDGKNSQAKELAAKIETGQTAEVSEMRKLLQAE